MKIPTVIGVLAAAALLASTSTLLAKGAVKQTANVVGQGPAGPLVAENGATVTRTKNGVGIALTMPTPLPGSYNYPPPNPFQPVAPVPGTPEVFTGWAFIFNQPENCAVPNQCVPPPPGAAAPNDFTTARGGVYNFAGHPVSGGGAESRRPYIRGGVAIRWTVRARKPGSAPKFTWPLRRTVFSCRSSCPIRFVRRSGARLSGGWRSFPVVQLAPPVRTSLPFPSPRPPACCVSD